MTQISTCTTHTRRVVWLRAHTCWHCWDGTADAVSLAWLEHSYQVRLVLFQPSTLFLCQFIAVTLFIRLKEKNGKSSSFSACSEYYSPQWAQKFCLSRQLSMFWAMAIEIWWCKHCPYVEEVACFRENSSEFPSEMWPLPSQTHWGSFPIQALLQTQIPESFLSNKFLYESDEHFTFSSLQNRPWPAVSVQNTWQTRKSGIIKSS